MHAQRTLVKSPPELWAEISDVEALARRLGEFGEIRITRVEPETTVAWEGDVASGTVELEPSGWGTKVTLTAELAEVAPPAEPPQAKQTGPEPAAPEGEPPAEAASSAPVQEPPAAAASAAPVQEPPAEAASAAPVQEPPAEVASADTPAEGRPGFLARLFRRRRAEAVAAAPVAAEPEPEPVAQAPEPERVAAEPEPVAQAPEPEPVAAEPEPEPVAPAPETEPTPAPLDPERAEALLVAVLDDLGSAHHRPFSRG